MRKLKQHWGFTTPVWEWAKSRTLTPPNAGEGAEPQEACNYWWWEWEVIQTLWKIIWAFLTKPNIFLPCDPATVLLHIYFLKLKTYFQTKTCTWIFIAALFIIAKSWKHQMPFSSRLIYLDNRILFSAKMKWVISPWKDMHTTRGKKPIWKGAYCVTPST